MRRSTLPRIATACAVACSAALVGCETGSPKTPPAPSPSPSVPPSPSPSEPPTPEPVALPGCEEALPLSRLRELYGDPRIESIPETDGLRDYTLQHGFGPVAADALVGAEQSVHCVWGYPNSDFVIQVYAAVLDDGTRAALVEALDDSVFERLDEGQTIVFTDHTEVGVSPVLKTYLFRGDLWVSEMSSAFPGAAGREYLERVAG